MALRRTAASMRRPRSRSIASCRAALTAAEGRLAAARTESGAAAAPPARDSVMGGFLSESRKGSNHQALSFDPDGSKPFPARLSLSALAQKNGDRRCTPVPKHLRTARAVQLHDLTQRRRVV